jgi:GntR family transcriptional regulator / MocR family aminotransferase
MPKLATFLPLALAPRDPHLPAARWLGAALRAEILEGRLRPGARLPATRDLARQHGLSRGTIVSAFEQLKSEGYVEGRIGSGTYVSRNLPDEWLEVGRKVPRRSEARPSPQRIPPRSMSEFGRQVHPFPGFGLRPTRAFRANLPALDLFPTTLWAQVAGRRLRRASTSLLLGCASTGYRPLQQAVAEYLITYRGVKCLPEQVIIVSGAQEALDLVARLLLNPGDHVCMENPGYIGAALVFEALGAKLSAIPLDDEGMEIPDPHLRGVRLAYITPAHQFPVGVTMTLARRLALLEWARVSGALILEDDYDSEFRYAGHPVPALQGLDRHGLVLFMGSFSKVLFPSLRLGYLVIPPDLVDHVAAAKSLSSRHAPVLEQAVLCDFITEGHFGRHLRRMRQVYAERLFALLESARQRLTGLLEISGVEAGLQTAGRLPAGIDGESAAQAAAARDVEVVPLSRYGRGRLAWDGLQLGFAAVDTQEIRRGVLELAVVLEGEMRRAPGGRARKR